MRRFLMPPRATPLLPKMHLEPLAATTQFSSPSVTHRQPPRSRGTYSLTMKPAGGPAAGVSDSGNYLARWKRDGGKWVIAEHAWTSSNPPMPMGPPARH